MRPEAKFNGFQEQKTKKVIINGPRPSPLMINKDSHLIRKPSVADHGRVHKRPQIREPIIIYTQSPKVIHTKAQDFMALVQRLTGMTSNSNRNVTASVTASAPRQHEGSENLGSSLSDVSNGSSVKQQQQEEEQNIHETSSALKEAMNFQYSPSTLRGFADMPLFTPNSSDLIFQSRSVYKYSDSPYGILGNLISPSGLDFIKELPEY